MGEGKGFEDLVVSNFENLNGSITRISSSLSALEIDVLAIKTDMQVERKRRELVEAPLAGWTVKHSVALNTVVTREMSRDMDEERRTARSDRINHRVTVWRDRLYLSGAMGGFVAILYHAGDAFNVVRHALHL